MKTIDLHSKYGRWTVKELVDCVKGRDRWLCVCDCGTEKTVYGSHLRFGKSKSCGCLRKEITSAMRKTWIGPKNPNWGKRGEETSQYGRRGELSSKWKGGRSIKDGYIFLYTSDHPRANNGRIAEHILVMEKMFGGPLPEGAIVHHCNGDKADNRPYNLRLFSSNAEHVTFHQKMAREQNIKHPNCTKSHFFNRHSGAWEPRKAINE